MRALALTVFASAAILAGAPPGLPAQASATRFEIVATGDSTISFSTARERWVRRGQQGIAVDPARRDALVARLLVLEVAGGQATALVTGQTVRLTEQHVVLLQRPATPFYRQRSFWIGAVLGAAVGVAASQ